MKRSLFAILLLVCAASYGEISEMDRLEYQNRAHEASNQRFLALVELGGAKSETAGAQFSYDIAVKLRARNSASAFDYSNALMKLMRCKFAEQRAQFHLEAAGVYEQIANLRKTAVETGRETPKEQAVLNLTLSRKRHALIEELDRSLVPFAKEIEFQFNSEKSLLAKADVSAEEFNKMKLVHDDVVGLVAATKAELIQSQKQKEESEKEIK